MALADARDAYMVKPREKPGETPNTYYSFELKYYKSKANKNHLLDLYIAQITQLLI